MEEGVGTSWVTSWAPNSRTMGDTHAIQEEAEVAPVDLLPVAALRVGGGSAFGLDLLPWLVGETGWLLVPPGLGSGPGGSAVAELAKPLSPWTTQFSASVPLLGSPCD